MSIFYTGKPRLATTKVVPIFLTISDNFSPYAAVAINSITKHADPKRYYRVIILSDGLNPRNRWGLRNLVTNNVEIQFHKIKNSIYLKAIVKYCSTKTGAGDFFSSAVYYYRSFIARLFPQYEKAIYIDSDTVVTGDIGELFDINLGDNVIGAVVDPKVEQVPEFREYVKNALGVPYEEYVNSGVMLMDLKKLRKLHYISTMIHLINEFDADLVAPDQDYLNVILKGKIMHIPDEWNKQPTKTSLPTDAKLYHFNLFRKPWFYDNVDGEEIFWDAAKDSGFMMDLDYIKKSFTLTDQRYNEAKVEALIKKAGEKAKTKEPLLVYEPEKRKGGL